MGKSGKSFAKRVLTAVLALSLGVAGISAVYASGGADESREFPVMYASGNPNGHSKNAKRVSLTYKGQKVSGTMEVKVKKTYQFKAVTTPKGCRITWLTSKPKVASVNQKGRVKIKKAGLVKITAKAPNGKKAVVKLKASNNSVKVKKLKITGKKSMKVRKSQTLKLAVTPATADIQGVKWRSSDRRIAVVNSKGKVIAKKKGTVRITASVKGGSQKAASIVIKVKK